MLPPMPRSIVIAILALLLWTPLAHANHLILTGGPALRKWENLRVEQDRHDRWWANFIRASTLRMVEIRKAYGPDAAITWVVHRPGYVTRAREDGKPFTTWIPNLARDRNVTLIWIDSNTSLINALNRQPKNSIKTFDYFGHSNKYCFMLDYGNNIMAASTVWLHQDELHQINRSIFSKNAYCKSWGCHTGESMSKAWKRALGVPLEGAIGPTDYTVVGQAKLPVVKGRWAR